MKLDEARKALHQKHFSDEACKHSNFERRRLITSNGGFQVKNQCLDCGKIGQAKKRQPGDENLPLIDRQMQADLWQKRQEAYQRELEQLEEAYRQKMVAEYQKYLDSDEWHEIREKVLQRDNYTCQGCLLRRATCVHHLTYENIKDELCYQLVSLCKECHEKAHRKASHD